VQQWGVVPAQLRDQLGQLRSERLEAADNIAQPVGLFLTDTTEGNGECANDGIHDIRRQYDNPARVVSFCDRKLGAAAANQLSFECLCKNMSHSLDVISCPRCVTVLLFDYLRRKSAPRLAGVRMLV
jgi:hypothetical protein